jgi:2-C-methyl-D-erythritol 4-phosphate cytidylyltransferase
MEDANYRIRHFPRPSPMTLSFPDPDLYAVVPCAGVGERAGAGQPKQYAQVAGHSLVHHTLQALRGVARLRQVLVVLAPGDTEFESHAPGHTGWVARVGGASRAASVAGGLDELVRRGARADDWVLVHDAARCLVLPEWIDALIDACLDDGVGGLLALPVSDTLKHEHAGRVAATLDRAAKWQAQTPQMFRLGALRDALSRAGAGMTDEASAMEAAGWAPRLVPSSMENFKITYPGDFALAERLFKTRDA